MNTAIPFPVILLSCFIQIHSLKISLDHHHRDGTWTVRNENGTYKTAATVPGGIYTDLQAAKILREDIYFQFNDIEYRWVSKENWTYSRTIEVPDYFFEGTEIYLIFHGVDTVASIYLNAHPIGNCENMFVRYKFPIKSILKYGTNELQVRFESPITAAKARYEKQSQKYIVPPKCVPGDYHGECHVNHLRKMQASFAWDWGPAFPSVGLWKGIEIESVYISRLRDVTIQTVETDKWLLYVTFFLEALPETFNISGVFSATINLGTHNQTLSKNETIFSDVPGHFNTTLILEIPKHEIQTWWPNGYGVQKLYPLSVIFNCGNETDMIDINVGFRTIELIQDPMTKGTGKTFYFKVNNIPIFAKGSNWIPSHVLPEKSAELHRIEHLLDSARTANMNMLRVWGGGLYESDLFYQLADEKGLLIWQDFMFACSLYPTDEDFLHSVSTEVTQQVRRLQHHPSIAIWAGNNENEGALRDNWYKTSINFTLYKNDYIKLYVDTIRRITLVHDNTRPFVVSSPSNGIESEKEGYIAANPGSSFYGDIHYYNYIANGWNPNTYRTTRFSSEYGFQSMPSFVSIAEVSVPTDWSMDSNFSRHRQHHPHGNSEMRLEIAQNLDILGNMTDAEEFPIFIHLSQINQAMAIKAETEFYRRSRSLLASDGQGLTMGALYWQLNDIWQAPSWASIEFNGRWKQIHYFAKDFFAPVLVSPFITAANNLEVHIISDQLEDLESTLTVSVYKWDSVSPVYNVSSNHTVIKASVTKVLEDDMLHFLQTAGCGDSEPGKNCFLYFTLMDLDGVNISPPNFLFPQSLKGLINFTTPDITIANVSLITGSNRNFEIVLKTDRVALFVWLEAYNIKGHFSSNGFIMVTSNLTIQFTANQDVTVNQLKKSMTIVSLADLYEGQHCHCS